jgi:hypothetical protein
MKVLGSLAVTLAQDWAKDNQPAASPTESPAPVQPAAAPSDGGNAPDANPAPAASSAPADPAAAMSAAASDIRAYLGASSGGFASFTSGTATVSPDGVSEWTLKPPAGASTISCVPAQQSSQTLLVCPMYDSARPNVDAMALGLLNDLDGTLPVGWTLERQSNYESDPNGTYGYLRGPGTTWGVIRAANSADDPNSYSLGFVLAFEQPQQ